MKDERGGKEREKMIKRKRDEKHGLRFFEDLTRFSNVRSLHNEVE